MVHVFRSLDQDFGVRGVVLEADSAVLRELVGRHAVAISEDERPEGRPERDHIILSRPTGAVDELLQGGEECEFRGTDAILDYKEQLGNDSPGDVAFGTCGIRRRHLAVSPAAQQFENRHGAVEHLVHGDIGLFGTIPLHE